MSACPFLYQVMEAGLGYGVGPHGRYFPDHKLNPCCVKQVVEAGLGHLPFTERSVITPTGSPYVGVDFAKKLCGVSIIRSGESMENALRACCKGIKIGKILVHRCAIIHIIAAWVLCLMARHVAGWVALNPVTPKS